ncbi:hypothetical protein Peur_016724 [Populus x canadensis]
MWADSISHLIFPRTQLYLFAYHGGCSWTKHGSCRCVPVSKSSVFQRPDSAIQCRSSRIGTYHSSFRA